MIDRDSQAAPVDRDARSLELSGARRSSRRSGSGALCRRNRQPWGRVPLACLLALALTALGMAASGSAVAARSVPPAQPLKIVGQPMWDPTGRRLLVVIQDAHARQRMLAELFLKGDHLSVVSSVGLPSGATDVQWAGPSHALFVSFAAHGEAGTIETTDFHGRRRTLGHGWYPVPSPDGKWLAFWRSAGDKKAALAVLSISHPLGSRHLVRGAESNLDRMGWWSPDSRWFGFFRQHYASPGVVGVGPTITLSVVSPASPENPRTVVRCRDTESDYGIGWLGADRILFGRYTGLDGWYPGAPPPKANPGPKGLFGVYSAPVTGGRVTEVIKTGKIPPPPGEPRWLASGKLGYPTRLDGTRYKLVDLASGKVRALSLQGGSNVASYSFSENGRWLALSSLHGSDILLVRTEGTPTVAVRLRFRRGAHHALSLETVSGR